ncbi:hypothetical protein DRJ17_05865, partial [Candidatus Woesearchaeota archaeon]
WLEAKAAEDAARRHRIEIEESITAELGVREEGAQTYDLGTRKITVTAVVNRTLDRQAWESVEGRIPEDLRPVKYEPKLDVAGVKWLHANDPATYRIVARALVVKPGKTNVKVTVIDKEKR